MKGVCPFHAEPVQAQHLIFKEEDYKEYYSGENRTLLDFYKGIFKTWTLVFIGFSFNDLYVRDMLKRVHGEIDKEKKRNAKKTGVIDQRWEEVRHYAFIKRSEIDGSLRQELERIKIAVLAYERHADYEAWLKRILRASEGPVGGVETVC